jgi:hypothetical protein
VGLVFFHVFRKLRIEKPVTVDKWLIIWYSIISYYGFLWPFLPKSEITPDFRERRSPLWVN